METEIKIVTGEDIIPFRREINRLSRISYPVFILEDNATIHHDWRRIYTDFIDYQIVLAKEGKVAAFANSIPLFVPDDAVSLPDEGWDWALATGYKQFDEKIKPNVLIGLSVVVNPEMRGSGLSKACLFEFKKLARSKGLKKIYIPVRPTRKPDFPEIPFEEYIDKKTDGRCFDPWLNLHYSLGGKFIGVCRRSMRTVADLATWKKWTGIDFPKSGQYIVPRALDKITVDKENDQAVYLEPNVWIEHHAA